MSISSAIISVFRVLLINFSNSLSVLARKMKEMSIRKVLGATVWNLGRIINKEFFWSVLLACLIGGPLSFLGIKSILTEISPEMTNPGLLPILVAFLGLLGITSIAVVGYVYNAYVKNPIVYLRDE